MNSQNRPNLTKKYVKLVKETRTEKVIPYLVECGILSEEMSEYIVNV